MLITIEESLGVGKKRFLCHSTTLLCFIAYVFLSTTQAQASRAGYVSKTYHCCSWVE